MKTKIHGLPFFTSIAAGLLVAAGAAQATNFAGNGSTAWGGNTGTGTLTVTDDGTNITFHMIPTGGSFGGNGLAVYIDTGTGGFASTSGFLDAQDAGHTIISGYSSQGQSVMTFASGFQPAYAISFSDGYTSLFQLANGGNNSCTYITGEGSTPYSFTFPAADLGLTPGATATIRIFGSLISTSGYRSPEAIAGNDAGSAGWNPFTQTAFSTYVFNPAVVPTNYVTFSVDMTEEIALGNFNPGNGDTVYAAGSFQSSAWTPGAFLLTNNPSAANTNLYSGTYPDLNAAGITEQYKYNYISVSRNSTNWENITTINNRYFTLSSGEVLPTSYFSNLPASPSATTNTVVFQIDLGPQIYLGNFNPGNGDLIEVFGSFDGTNTWPPGHILTNNPTGAQPNVYLTSFTDGNYPGTQYQYKYVIVSGGSTDNYESTPNRVLVTPTGYALLPLAYFNNASNVYATPVTFQVDMTAPIAAGNLNLTNGDTVSAAGTFQSSLNANQWKPGLFVLTNNPTANNTNIFTGTFIDPNPPGTSEQFKFQINPAGNGNNATWESIGNRSFQLGSTAQTLPLVNWNNQDPYNILPASTTITFTVDMTNAVDRFGFAFDAANDTVVVNGDFLTPTWPNFWADPLLGGFDYTANMLQNNGTDLLYTGTFTVPAGHSLEVQYKYGIIHNYTGSSNTNCDNEAVANANHVRYIRAIGTYNFPMDIFGIQQTNPPAAIEPSFGHLAIAAPVAGKLPISWLGRPGVYLQYATNLTGPWVRWDATGGLSATNWPQSGSHVFFRLVNP
ncbi:MAG TPA: hypothetical protein VF988_08390 [Verrucomicrobiae bacterium]